MLVAFEGMDGCGKTTISNLVSMKTGYTHETQKLCRLANISESDFSEFVKNIRYSENEKLAFIFYTFRCMLDKSDNNNNTIVERSMASTYYFEHNKIDLQEFDYVMQLGMIPEITFLLYASSDERKRRIYKRNPNDEDLKRKESLDDGYPIMIEFLERYNIPYICIDTEKYNAEEISDYCSMIIKYIENLSESERINFINEIKSSYADKIYQRRLKK